VAALNMQTETVSAFLARGGRIVRCAPSKRPAYRPTKLLNMKRGHNLTGRIVRVANALPPSDGPRVSSLERLSQYQCKYRHLQRMQ